MSYLGSITSEDVFLQKQETAVTSAAGNDEMNSDRLPVESVLHFTQLHERPIFILFPLGSKDSSSGGLAGFDGN